MRSLSPCSQGSLLMLGRLRREYVFLLFSLLSLEATNPLAQTNESLITDVLASLTTVRIPPLAFAHKSRTRLPSTTSSKRGWAESTRSWRCCSFGIRSVGTRSSSSELAWPLGRTRCVLLFFLFNGLLLLSSFPTSASKLLTIRRPSVTSSSSAAHHPRSTSAPPRLTHTHTSLDSAVFSELSLKTKKAFTFALLGKWKNQVDGGKGEGAAVGGSGGAGKGVLYCADVGGRCVDSRQGYQARTRRVPNQTWTRRS